MNSSQRIEHKEPQFVRLPTVTPQPATKRKKHEWNDRFLNNKDGKGVSIQNEGIHKKL